MPDLSAATPAEEVRTCVHQRVRAPVFLRVSASVCVGTCERVHVCPNENV